MFQLIDFDGGFPIRAAAALRRLHIPIASVSVKTLDERMSTIRAVAITIFGIVIVVLASQTFFAGGEVLGGWKLERARGLWIAGHGL
jgi:hypothetical protein